MNLKHSYEKHLAEKLVQLPPPDDPDQNWQQMKVLLDKNMPRGGGGPKGAFRWWVAGTIIVAVVVGTWFGGRSLLSKEQSNETVAGTIKTVNNKNRSSVASTENNVEQGSNGHANGSGKKDLRGAYGFHARQMLLLLNQFQHARALNIVFVGILEFATDEFNRGLWQLQCEGSKVGRELPGIVDEIITYQFLDFGDGKPPERGFVCTSPNAWGYPAKDRSGHLDQIEPPDLGRLLDKLIIGKQKDVSK